MDRMHAGGMAMERGRLLSTAVSRCCHSFLARLVLPPGGMRTRKAGLVCEGCPTTRDCAQRNLLQKCIRQPCFLPQYQTAGMAKRTQCK